MKQSNAQLSLSHRHHHNQIPGRLMFLKRSRYHGSHHHCPQHHSSANHSSNSMYRGNKRTPFPDQNQKLSFKVGGRWNSHLGHNSDIIGKVIHQTDRIRASSSSATEMISSAASNTICVLCQDPLGHNPENHHARSSGILLPEEPCVVAVLVCGHAFHADCLERGTQMKEARDPPCPLCLGWSAKAQDA